MARIGTSYSRQTRDPRDAQRDREEQERLEGLRAYSGPVANTEPEERDLTAAATAALDEKFAGMGSGPLSAAGVDAGIVQAKERADARVEESKLSQAERQAKLIGQATAEAIIPLLSPQPGASSPEVDDLLADEEESEADYYTDEAGAIWMNDGGSWSRVDDEAKAEEYDAVGEWAAGVDERQGAAEEDGWVYEDDDDE